MVKISRVSRQYDSIIIIIIIFTDVCIFMLKYYVSQFQVNMQRQL